MPCASATPASATVSVVTPTFNRAELLPRLYDSIRAQTVQPLEWVVIDDGSTDGTEALIAGWRADAPFSIVYRRQANHGKHVALNRAFDLVRGEYTAMIDSDDWYLPHALSCLLDHWTAIPAERRGQFVSVEARCQDPDGRPIGRPLPTATVDSDYFAIWADHGADGDTVGLLRTAALDGYRFPEEDRGVLVTESLLWHRIALRYRTRFVADLLKVNDYQPTGLSARAQTAWKRDARPMRTFHREIATMPRPMRRRLRLKAAANYLRFSLHAGISPVEAWDGIAGHRRLAAAAAPIGAMLYLRDHAAARRERCSPRPIDRAGDR